MKNIFQSRTVPLQLKVNIFKAAVVLAILLYGCEEKSLNSLATNCYRIMLNFKRLDKKRNEEIYRLISQEPIAVTVQQRQFRFLGDCLRKKQRRTYQQIRVIRAKINSDVPSQQTR